MTFTYYFYDIRAQLQQILQRFTHVKADLYKKDDFY